MTNFLPSGRGIGIAVLDTGIFPHVDFDNRIIAFYDVVNGRISAYDDNSHGTHVTGIAAGSGLACQGKHHGAAYQASLIGIKTLGANGYGKMEQVLKGLEWIRKNYRRYNIRVVNISFAQRNTEYAYEQHPLILAVEELWELGIVVVTAAGNDGPSNCSIGIPGMSRRIITVGAYDRLHMKNKDGSVQYRYSGRGCEQLPFIKPEIVARGSMVTSCKNNRYGYTTKSGSSMAAPYISGMVAALLEKYPDMEPIDVKLRLHDRAISLGLPQNVEGWGTIDESFLF